MTAQELKDYILKHMTAEEALEKLLISTLVTYNKLKFPEGSEPVHPEILIAMAALDLGWGIAVETKETSETVRGLILGTDEYMKANIKS